MKYALLTAIMITTMIPNAFVQERSDGTVHYRKVPTGYLMVLRQGDNLFNELELFAAKEKILSANFTGMGFVNVKFGFFDFKKKEYLPKELNDVELASMHGTIAYKADKVSIHAHGVVGDRNFNAHAGHILSATVSTGSLEIIITPHDIKLERKKDEQIGADVLSLE